MSDYDVAITVKALTPDLHDLDREVGTLFSYRVNAVSDEQAREQALDLFHSQIPIKNRSWAP